MKKLLLSTAALVLLVGSALYLFPGLLITAYQHVERLSAGLTSQDIQVDGMTIGYDEGGDPDKETIVMIHGFATNRDNWLRLAPFFTKDFHVIALDLPGFGESSKPERDYDVDSQTKRLHAFIQKLGLTKVHLAGSSMGGHIAALYSARYPDEVLSLALMNNAGITAPHKSELYERIEQGNTNPLVIRNAEDFQKLIDFVFFKPPSLPAPLKHYLADQAIANSAHYDQVFDDLRYRYVPLEPELPKIQAPTLLLWGDKDRVLDVSSIEVMKPLLRNASVAILKDCGHAPMIERPEETAQLYLAFLQANKKPAR